VSGQVSCTEAPGMD